MTRLFTKPRTEQLNTLLAITNTVTADQILDTVNITEPKWVTKNKAKLEAFGFIIKRKQFKKDIKHG